MGTFKGTKGEWKIDPLNPISIVDNSTDRVRNLICQTNGKLGEEREANAKLIAAAPEMLEALEKIILGLNDGEYTVDQCYKFAKEAYNKATE